MGAGRQSRRLTPFSAIPDRASRVRDDAGSLVGHASLKPGGADAPKPGLYAHPIGFHGHAAGSPIGWWDDQSYDHPKGYRALRPNTAWSIELNATAPVPEWGGQEVVFKTEEDAFFDGESVRYLDGRQVELQLVGRGG